MDAAAILVLIGGVLGAATLVRARRPATARAPKAR